MMLLLLLVVCTSVEVALGFESSSRGRLDFFSGRSFALFGGDEKARQRKLEKQSERQEYESRRNAWLEKYGSVEALQQTFGRAPIFGDLTPEQTRRLYHTLLPRSLLGLYEMGLMKPEELAPLAYNARIAAKEYARSRCNLSGRLITSAFDLYRGRFGKRSSMSWEEIFKKYEAQIVEEVCTNELKRPSDEDLTMQIYLRILERSCSTNQAFDSLFLKEKDDDDSDYLSEIADKLENDVRFLLLSSNKREKAEKVEKEMQKAEEKKEKKQLKMEQKEQKVEQKELKRRQKAIRKHLRHQRRLKEEAAELHNAATNAHTAANNESKTNTKEPPATSKRWKVLRIMAGTRRKDKKLNRTKS
eukprot:scaffold1830_cov117-Cylindrotheca_fusiformis.AAC.5